MRLAIAIGLALTVVLLAPTALSNQLYISYAVPPSPVIQVHQPLVMAPVTPLSEGIGARAVKDITLSTETAVRDVEVLTYWDLMFVLAETSWRSYITSNTFYAEELGMWFHDDYYRDKLYALMMCESSGRVDAIGDVGLGRGISAGLFQINTGYWPELAQKYNFFIPEENAQAAYEIWVIQGWEAWSCHGR